MMQTKKMTMNDYHHQQTFSSPLLVIILVEP